MNEELKRRLAALKETATRAWDAYGSIFALVRDAENAGRGIDTPEAREKYAPAEIQRRQAVAQEAAKAKAREALNAYAKEAEALAAFRDLYDPEARVEAAGRLTPAPVLVNGETLLSHDRVMLAAIQEQTKQTAALVELQTRDRARRDLAHLHPDDLVKKARALAESGEVSRLNLVLEELGAREIDPEAIKTRRAHVLGGLNAPGLQEAGAVHRVTEKIRAEVAHLSRDLEAGKFTPTRAGMLEHLGANLDAAVNLPTAEDVATATTATEKGWRIEARKAAGLAA